MTQGTVYLTATTVPRTVVALRRKWAETATWARFPKWELARAADQPMQLTKVRTSPGQIAGPDHAELKWLFSILKSKMPLQKLPESASILVWSPVALVDTLVSERRFGSPNCSPPRPPVAGLSWTVLLIAVPPSCRLSFRLKRTVSCFR